MTEDEFQEGFSLLDPPINCLMILHLTKLNLLKKRIEIQIKRVVMSMKIIDK